MTFGEPVVAASKIVAPATESRSSKSLTDRLPDAQVAVDGAVVS